MKKVLFIGGILLITVLGTTLNSYADRCSDVCVPEANGTCALPDGEGGVLVCGASDNYHELKPIEP
ncbi:hypothetical protein [Draconibacterium halophilum]|uniref:Uncharacterized protein n=1 Tax=Draconibacterium halophilum TaxID=2706887 RepID=A0A6C0RBK9_9BACT|nr:hypothetical protein [Draconibacterium halophilum]QIA06561.1 hypothetical protein G0Q07_01920 [Draconibacterium halophilum]